VLAPSAPNILHWRLKNSNRVISRICGYTK
jgi:hypothetical protein